MCVRHASAALHQAAFKIVIGHIYIFTPPLLYMVLYMFASFDAMARGTLIRSPLGLLLAGVVGMGLQDVSVLHARRYIFRVAWAMSLRFSACVLPMPRMFQFTTYNLHPHLVYSLLYMCVLLGHNYHATATSLTH